MAKRAIRQNGGLPINIYVVTEEDGEDTYFNASDEFGNFDAADTVGVYQLVETKTLVVTKELL